MPEASLSNTDLPRFSSSGVVSMVSRAVLVGVFLYAGVVKIINPAEFAGSIATFEILPEGWSNFAALFLPPFEILAALLLLVRSGVSIGSLSLMGLSGIFLIALVSAVLRGLPVDCGCFGSSGPSSPSKIWLAVCRDVVLLGMSLFVYSFNCRER